MEVAHCKAFTLAGLCISFAIKPRRFRAVSGSFGVASGLLHLARAAARVSDLRSNNGSTPRPAAIDVAAVEAKSRSTSNSEALRYQHRVLHPHFVAQSFDL